MTAQESGVWTRAQETIKKELNNERTYIIWFGPIKFVSLAEDTITLEVPNKFFKGWLLDRYITLISSSVSKASGRDLKIDFVLKEPGDEEVLARPRPAESQKKREAVLAVRQAGADNYERDRPQS